MRSQSKGGLPALFPAAMVRLGATLNSVLRRQVREVLRLRYAYGSEWAADCRRRWDQPLHVAEYLRRAAVIGLTWPVLPELDDAALERKLFTLAGFATAGESQDRQPRYVGFQGRQSGLSC